MISKSFRCLSCEETFYDRETLLSHLGVKHNLINRVLEEKSLPRIPLDQVQIHFHAFNLIRMSLVPGDIGTGREYQARTHFCGATKFAAKLPN